MLNGMQGKGGNAVGRSQSYNPIPPMGGNQQMPGLGQMFNGAQPNAPVGSPAPQMPNFAQQGIAQMPDMGMAGKPAPGQPTPLPADPSAQAQTPALGLNFMGQPMPQTQPAQPMMGMSLTGQPMPQQQQPANPYQGPALFGAMGGFRR